MNERVLRFGDDDSLIGIYTPAATPGKRYGIVLLNAGVVHRSGPNRLYVNIARQLATAGYPVLRFDLSGIGDSRARCDDLSFEEGAVHETSAAMAVLGAQSGSTGFILCGICSGADISFLTARDNAAVRGAVLINGRALHGVTDDAGDAIESAITATDGSARYLLKSALFNPSSWRKLFSGRVNYLELLRIVGRRFLRPLASPGRAPDTAPELRAAFHAVLNRGTRLLLVYSEGDPAPDYMKLMFGKEMRRIAAHPNFAEVYMQGADHTFTPRCSRIRLITVLRDWADARFAA